MKIMTRVVGSKKTKTAEWSLFFSYGVIAADKDTKTHR